MKSEMVRLNPANVQEFCSYCQNFHAAVVDSGGKEYNGKNLVAINELVNKSKIVEVTVSDTAYKEQIYGNLFKKWRVNMQVQLRTVKEVKDFVNVTKDIKGKIILCSGDFRIDGRSLLGIFSLDLSKPINIKCQDVTESDLEKLNDWLIK